MKESYILQEIPIQEPRETSGTVKHQTEFRKNDVSMYTCAHKHIFACVCVCTHTCISTEVGTHEQVYSTYQ